MKSILIVSLFLFGFVSCDVNEIDDETPTEENLKRALTEKCGPASPSSCIALELVGYVDRMLRTAAIQLSDDVLVLDDSNGASAEPVPSASLARAGSSLTDQAQQLIADKLWSFATTRSLRYRLVDNADLVLSSARQADGSIGVGVTVKQSKDTFEGRRRGTKNMGPLLAAAAMKIGLMGALAFKGLALLVGKALLIGKIALLLSSIIGLKKLFSNQE